MAKKNYRQADPAPKLNDGFDQPKIIDDVLYAFPGETETLLPTEEIIPDAFKADARPRNEWVEFVNAWFHMGWPEDRDVYERPDVEGQDAFRHLHTVLRSYEPSHQHKIAGVAWLMSRWFSEIRPA